MKKILSLSFSFVLLTFLGGSPLLYSQEFGDLPQKEMELDTLLRNLRKVKTDAERDSINSLYKDKLYKAIQQPNAFDYPFSKLRTMGSVKSSDNAIRLFNWNVEMEDLSNVYYCYIVRYDDRKKAYVVNELVDNSILLPEKPSEILEANNWYGALYYEIVPFEKGRKDMYILLGWDGHGTVSNMKLIDVLYFNGNNPKLGSPVFKVGNETFKRLFYEHSEKCTMSLRYDERFERILFDHLSPESPNLKGFYAYYVPDMSYDAFKLKNGKWILEEDVIAVNPKAADKIDVYVQDSETGKVTTRRMKNKWIDPSDSKAPAGGNTHVAEMPDESDPKASKKDKKDRKSNRTDKTELKDKRDPSKLYPYNDLKKKRRKKKSN